jgi:hypothetical protein
MITPTGEGQTSVHATQPALDSHETTIQTTAVEKTPVENSRARDDQESALDPGRNTDGQSRDSSDRGAESGRTGSVSRSAAGEGEVAAVTVLSQITEGAESTTKSDRQAKTAQNIEPHVVRKSAKYRATLGQVAEVVDLAAERRNRRKTHTHSVATRGAIKLRKSRIVKGSKSVVVEPVKASKGTWAFRLRVRIDGVRNPPIYVSRVSDLVYQMIREGDYESFKKQLIESYSARAVRSGNGA